MFYLCGILLLYHGLDATCCRFIIAAIDDEYYFTQFKFIFLPPPSPQTSPLPLTQHNINQQLNNSPPNLQINQTLISNDTFSAFTNLFFNIDKLLIR